MITDVLHDRIETLEVYYCDAPPNEMAVEISHAILEILIQHGLSPSTDWLGSIMATIEGGICFVIYKDAYRYVVDIYNDGSIVLLRQLDKTPWYRIYFELTDLIQFECVLEDL